MALPTAPKSRCKFTWTRWVLGLTAAFGLSGGALAADAGPTKQVIQTATGARIEVALPAGANQQQNVVEALEAALRELKQQPVVPAAAKPETLPAAEPKTERLPIDPTVVIPGDPACGDVFAPAWRITYLPATLLWQPPLAQPGQPRTYLLDSSAEEYYTNDTVDTAIGGTFALARYGACDDPRHAVQADFFAVVFSRFAQTSRLLDSDYRFGFIGTFAWGGWEGKFGYEHTSTHIGDEYLDEVLDFRKELIRDELVIALGYRWLNQFRFYGQVAYSLDIRTPGIESQRDRWNFGAEWYENVKSPWYGQPYAAVDADLRGDQDYQFNFTGQVGWMWRDPAKRPFFRLLAQYYNGRSIYGHFSDEDESWYALGMAMDY
jgi:hypothetical protein